jgi:hypothetical protein
MSIDLRLLVPDHIAVEWWLCTTVLPLNISWEFKDAMPPGHPCPLPVYGIMDEGAIAEDMYGNPITWLLCDEFLAAAPPLSQSRKNVGAISYLRTLPAEWPVVLFWL